MTTKPTEDLTWGESAVSGDIVEPTAPKKAAGWQVNDAPPAPIFNWWKRGVARWIAFLWASVSAVLSAASMSVTTVADTALRDALRSFMTGVLLGNWRSLQLASFSDNVQAASMLRTSAGDPMYYVFAGDDGKVFAIRYGNDSVQGAGTLGGYSSTWRGLATSKSVTSGPGILVVGDGGKMASVALGETTTTVSPTLTNIVPAGSYAGDFYDVASDDAGNYVAVGATGGTGVIQTIADATGTPTARTPGGSFAGGLFSVACKIGSPSIWVACGEDGEVQRSIDNGATWEHVGAPFGTSNWPSCVRWLSHYGLFVMTCGHRVATSPDGLTWTVRTSLPFSTSARVAITSGPGVVVAAWGSRLYTTSDFSTWVTREDRGGYLSGSWSGGRSFNDLSFGGGGFFGGGQSGVVLFSTRTM